MSGGWRGSNRRATLPGNWESEIVPAVKKRSKGRCEWPVKRDDGSFRRCTRPADGGVDHWKAPDYHGLDGLRASCHPHHGAKSSREGNDAKKAIRNRGRRPTEPHPGLIRRS